MLFESYYADLQAIVRSESIIYHPATGVEISRTPALIANFGRHLGEYTTPDWMTGGVHEGAHIQGHFFDSEVAQEEKGWTDDERVAVETELLRLQREQPYLVQQIILEVPAAPKPWPSYDAMTAKQITATAVGTGLVKESLSYELENQNRSTLVAELEKLATAVPTSAPQQSEAERQLAEITL